MLTKEASSTPIKCHYDDSDNTGSGNTDFCGGCLERLAGLGTRCFLRQHERTQRLAGKREGVCLHLLCQILVERDKAYPSNPTAIAYPPDGKARTPYRSNVRVPLKLFVPVWLLLLQRMSTRQKYTPVAASCPLGACPSQNRVRSSLSYISLPHRL